MRWGLVDLIDELVAGEYAYGVRTFPPICRFLKTTFHDSQLCLVC